MISRSFKNASYFSSYDDVEQLIFYLTCQTRCRIMNARRSFKIPAIKSEAQIVDITVKNKTPAKMIEISKLSFAPLRTITSTSRKKAQQQPINSKIPKIKDPK